MMKGRLLLFMMTLLIVCCFGVDVKAQTAWTGDITNADGLAFTIQYANPTSGDVAETWADNANAAFDLNQSLTGIPEGVYELSSNAMYRASLTYGTATNCVLYATVGEKEYRTPIANFGDYTANESLSQITQQMNNNDAYKNVIPCIIVKNGTATIGMKSIGALTRCTNGHWFVYKKSSFTFKNVTSEYHAKLVARATAMMATAPESDEKAALSAALSTYATASVASVEGLQEAIDSFLETATTDNPLDVTQYIANPSFENGATTYWYQDLGYTQGSNRNVQQPTSWNLMYSSAKVGNTQYQSFIPQQSDANAGEYSLYVRHRWGDVLAVENLHQKIRELPWGAYRLTVAVKANRTGNDANTLTLSAGDNSNTTTISSFTTDYQDYSVQVSKNTDEDMLDINYGFSQSQGVEQLYYVDNFRLYYLGDPSITALHELNETRALAASLTESPMNAAVLAALNTAISTYAEGQIDETDITAISTAKNALQTAINNAQASIGIYAQIKARLDLLTADAQRGSIPLATEQADAFYANYTNGEYENLDEVLPLYTSFVQTYWTENVAAEANLTAYMTNQGFEFGNFDGWNTPASNDTSLKDDAGTDNGTKVFNAWTNNVGTYPSLTLTRTVTGLPNGTYKISAGLLSSRPNATLSANAGSTEITDLDASAWKTYEATGVVSDGTLTITVYMAAQDNLCYYRADNFQITYLSAEATVAPALAEGLMNKDINAAQTAALATWTDDKSVENYNALVAAIDAAKASIAVYQTMNKYITAQKVTAGSTVDWTSIDGKYNAGDYVNATDFVADYQALVATALASPDENTDMTPFIINPDFEFGDMAGWANYSAGDSQVRSTAGSYAFSDTHGDYLFNTWNNNADLKYLVQTINGLPNGTYQLTATFASDADNAINLTAEGNGETANNFTTGSDKTVGVTKTVTVVVPNGTLKLGANSTAWFKVDNFQLTYLSTEATVAPILAGDQMNDDVKNAQDAAYEAWSEDKSMENYNTLVAAVNAAYASVAEYEKIKTRIDQLAAESQRGGLTEAQVKAMSFYTKYNNGDLENTGTYASLDEVIPEYKANIAAYYATNAPATGDDLTAFIVNQGFEMGNLTGWSDYGNSSETSVRNNDAFSGKEGNYYFNTWVGNNSTLRIRQTANGLPDGTYKLSAQLTGYAGKTITLYLNNQHKDFVVGDGDNVVNTANNVEVEGIVANGILNISVENIGSDNRTFFKADNFRLTFMGTELPDDVIAEANDLLDVDTTKPMNAAEKAAYEAAKAAWEGGDHSPAAYAAIVETAPVAEASIAAYERALAAINETFNVLTETNVYTEAGYKALFKTYNDYKKDYDNGLLEDDIAGTIQGAIFGDRTYQQKGVAIVPFLGSAWDDNGDYTWQGVREKNEIWEENYWNYWVNTWSNEGANDGSNFTVPFMEYWTEDDKTLTDRELTATVSAAPLETYTVTGKFRVRVAGGAEPTGIKLVLVSTNNNDEEVEFGPDYTEDETTASLNWHQQPITNSPITWTKVEGTDFWIADYSIKGHTAGTASATDGGALRTLQIKFVFESTNASWFAFKNMMYNPSKVVDANDYYQMMGNMNDAIAYAESHTLGFDFQGEGGYATQKEYAPWANAENLADLELLKDYKAVLDPLLAEHYDPSTGTITDNEGFMRQAPRYILVNNLIKKVAEAQWIENTNEVNGIYWREDYTADDVDVLQYYLADGSRGGTYYTIFPSGWDLNGRYDAYSTRVIKNNVNTTIFPTDQLENKAGMWAVSGQTVLFVKWDTNYGKETGYTLPLKPGVKYAFQFNYADWGDATAAETNIEIINNRTNNRVNITDLSSSAMDAPDNVNKFTLTGKGQQGDRNESNWYMYRGEFTTESGSNYTDDYVIYLKKTINERQMQIALGEITLVRAPEETKEYVINGDTRDEADDFTPAFDYESERRAIVTRTFNYNGGAGTWNTFVLPFKMDQKETEAMLGEGVELAYYIDCTLEGTYYTLNFERHKAGVLANRPCMVYYDSEKSLNNYVVDYAIVRGNNEKPETLDPQGALDMVGTYKILDIPADDIYISPDNQWKRSKGNTKLQPTRAYFRNVSGDPEVGAKLMGFRIDDVATGIMAIDDETGDMHVTSGNIYSLDGRLVRQNAKSLEGLQPGIYVVDGKKYYVK